MVAHITRTVFLFLCLLFSTKDSLGQKLPPAIAGSFFEIYKGGDTDKAIDHLFTYSPFADELRDGIDDVKRSLKKLLTQYGKYYGYELLYERSVSTHMVMLTYFVRHEREPLIINLLFYKPDSHWQLQNFKYSNPVEEELEEASRISRVKD